MKTLVIVSHPYPKQSNAIMALQKAALQQNDVTVRNLENLYGGVLSRFDVAAEQLAAEQADRIVFLFPNSLVQPDPHAQGLPQCRMGLRLGIW